MRADYDSLLEAIRDMRLEFPEASHFIVNPEDAEEAELLPHVDDDGYACFLVDGLLIYVSDLCPPGQIGACVDDDRVNTNLVGEA